MITLLVLGFSCSKEAALDIDSSYKPVEDLPWLATIVANEQSNADFAKYAYITQATYEGNTVFIYGNCCPACKYARTVWNCDGGEIGFIGTQEGDIKIEDLEDEEVVWKGKNTVCQL